jgi:hypothetical protein
MNNMAGERPSLYSPIASRVAGICVSSRPVSSQPCHSTGLGAALPERKGKKGKDEGSDGEEDPDFELNTSDKAMLMEAMASNRGALMGALQVRVPPPRPPTNPTTPHPKPRRRATKLRRSLGAAALVQRTQHAHDCSSPTHTRCTRRGRTDRTRGGRFPEQAGRAGRQGQRLVRVAPYEGAGARGGAG